MFLADGPKRNDRYMSGGGSVTIEFSMEFHVSSFISMNLVEGTKLLTILVLRKRNLVGFYSKVPIGNG